MAAVNNDAQILNEIEERIAEGHLPEARARIRLAARPTIGLLQLHKLAALLARTGADETASYKVKIAIGGNATFNYLQEALAFYLRLDGIEADIFLCPFGTLYQQAADPDSELFKFRPDIIWIFSTSRDLGGEGGEIQAVKNLWQSVQKNSAARILQNNFDLDSTRPLGHLESTLEFSKTRIVQRLNREIAESKPPGVAVLDYDWLSSLFGKSAWLAGRFWHQGKYPFAPEATALVSYNAAQIIQAMLGRAKKCLVLDLDNTLWGGTLGDDGVDGIQIGPDSPLGEAYLEFQRYILDLKNRGVLLAVCSKNDESLVNKAFAQHPGMLLKPVDFAAWQVNWKNKAENIQALKDQLGLGLESFVFVDDSAFERGLVRELLPEVCVPEMPEDIVDYAQTLDEGRYFESVSFSSEDASRNQMYADDRKRKTLQETSLDINSYLKSLGMLCTAADFGPANSARVEQLINKSNQFNLTGQKITSGRLGMGRCYRLTDRFGDNGIISAVVLRIEGDTMILQNWVMSCRVFLRGVEEFVHGDLLRLALKMKVKKIAGLYVRTEKNGLAAQHYAKLGYLPAHQKNAAERWEIDVQTAMQSPSISHIHEGRAER